MPYKLHVLVEKRVVLVQTIGHYSLDDMRRAVLDLVIQLDKSDASLIVLNDQSKIKSTHANLLDVREATSLYFSHQKHLLTIVYGTNEKVIVSFLVNSLAGLFKQPVKNLANETETVKFISTKYPDLAESLPQALADYHARVLA